MISYTLFSKPARQNPGQFGCPHTNTLFAQQEIHNCQLIQGRCKGEKRKRRDVKSDPNTLASPS